MPSEPEASPAPGGPHEWEVTGAGNGLEPVPSTSAQPTPPLAGCGTAQCHGLARRGIEVAEVIRPNRQARRRRGKSDAADAVAAAVAALSGEASGVPKSRDGAAESIRALRVARAEPNSCGRSEPRRDWLARSPNSPNALGQRPDAGSLMCLGNTADQLASGGPLQSPRRSPR